MKKRIPNRLWAVVDTRTGMVHESSSKRAVLESWRQAREADARWNGRGEAVVILEYMKAKRGD